MLIVPITSKMIGKFIVESANLAVIRLTKKPISKKTIDNPIEITIP